MKRNIMFINLCFIAYILIITFSFTYSDAANLDYGLLNKQTVKIKAGNEIGSGVLLCQKGDQINILTARHIFDSPYDTIVVEFYQDYCNPINLSNKELKVKRSGTLDIALLQIQVNKVQSCTLKFITIGTSNTIKLGQEVNTTGHPIGGSEQEWIFLTGKINKEIGEYITHSCIITNGYSGGPLVNERGELIGINVVVEGNVGQAIPIDSILPFLRDNKISIVEEKEPEAKKSPFRSKPVSLSEESATSMIKGKGFFDEGYNKNALGFVNDFVVQNDGEVVYDRASSLMWQQLGSNEPLDFAHANAYVGQLNREGFAGYHDWRLPTLEEAMSLTEPTKMNGGFHIDPKFDTKQRSIWTSDNTPSASRAWVVNFDLGYCYYFVLSNLDTFVRAVR